MGNLEPGNPAAILHIKAAYTSVCGKDWRWDSRLQRGELRSGYNLWYVASGRGHLLAAGHPYPLAHGDCFLLRSAEEHLGTNGQRAPVVVHWCQYEYFDGRGRRLPVDPVPRPSRGGAPRHRALEGTAVFEGLMERLIDAWRTGGDGPEAHLWLDAALAELGRQDQRLASRAGLPAEQAREMDRIRKLIRSEPGRPWRVRELAEGAGLCTDHFIRVFKRDGGRTPADFIIDCRIEAARSLLHVSSLTIERIADSLGYHDAFAFSRQFKQRTGCSPSQERERVG